MTSGPFSWWYFLLLTQRFFWYYFSRKVMAILCCVAQKAASAAQLQKDTYCWWPWQKITWHNCLFKMNSFQVYHPAHLFPNTPRTYVHPAWPHCQWWTRIHPASHIAGGGKGYTLHIHTSDGGNGYTLHVPAACMERGTPCMSILPKVAVYRRLVLVLFLSYDVEIS